MKYQLQKEQLGLENLAIVQGPCIQVLYASNIFDDAPLRQKKMFQEALRSSGKVFKKA